MCYESLNSLHCNIWLWADCCHDTTVPWGLTLREVLQDQAEVSQAVFEWGQGQDGGLIGGVQLEDWEQPPAPGWTVGGGLEDTYKGSE